MAGLILRLVTRGALVARAGGRRESARIASRGWRRNRWQLPGRVLGQRLRERRRASSRRRRTTTWRLRLTVRLSWTSTRSSHQRVKGDYGQWSTITPSPSIRIVGVTSTGVADCNLHSDGFSAFYFWGDNGTNFGTPQVTIDCNGATHQNGYAGSLSQHIQSSRYLGWQAQCNQASCTPTGAGIIVFSVIAIKLEAQETSGPALAADAGEQPVVPVWVGEGRVPS